MPTNNKNQFANTSRFLSYVLRHKPDVIGLSLDSNGWADVADLLRLSQEKAGRVLSREQLCHVVAANDKQRFTLSADGAKIRAAQGHSTATVMLPLEAQEPPEKLYHGTATRFLESILKSGVQPQQRHHVHLSSSRETALSVGRRHGKPVVLQVAAQAMHGAGANFFRSDNGVWLTACVPPEFLSLG